MHSDLTGWLLACVLFPATAMAQQEILVTKLTGSFEHGVGAEYRSNVAAANAAVINDKDLERATTALAPALRYCDQQQIPGRIAVSVANAEEYDHFMADHHDGMPVEWIDQACPAAYKAAAFIDVERKDFNAAIAMLAKAVAMAPYSPEPLTEQGFALNQMGRHDEALANYRKALDLSNAFEAARYAKALSLRGIGFTLVELTDLAAAREAYEQSLQAEPGNAIALQELDYIRQREAKGIHNP
jgi:tetratricopeptide (TPR) repeat protein